MRLPICIAVTAICFAASTPALAQMVPCSGDDTIYTGRGGSTQEWIQVKPGQGCEMGIEIGGRQQGIDFVKVMSKPKIGFAGTNGNHKVMYKSNGPAGTDSFDIGIGVIAPNGTSKLFMRKVNVTIAP